MGKSKRDIQDEIENMSDEEILMTLMPRATFEFEIMDKKFVFRNVEDEFMKDFGLIKFIRLVLNVEWYNYSFYDTVTINGINFLITEFSRKKIILVRGN